MKRPSPFLPSQEPHPYLVIDGGTNQRRLAHALYNEREAAYDHWNKFSGHLVAEAESDKRWLVVWALESRILQFPCKKLEEVAAKARYIVAAYGTDYAREKQHAFIAEVAGLVETAEVV